MTLVHQTGAAVLLVILTLCLQCAGLAVLITWQPMQRKRINESQSTRCCKVMGDGDLTAQLSRCVSTLSADRSTPPGNFQPNDLNFNHLRKTGIWHVPCPTKGMAQKIQFECEDTARTQLPGASRSRPCVELQQSLPSQVEAIEPFVGQLMCFISKFRNADGSETDIDLALHEALANAVIHGNGKNPDKRVYVVCRCDLDGEVLITIRDQGLGFDSGSIPDPTDPETLMSTHGRGIYLMRVLMDQVDFDEGGVVVRMRKKPNACSRAAADQP